MAPMSAYHQYVERLRNRKPSLSDLCHFLSYPPSEQQPCRVVSLDFFENAQAPKRTQLDYDGLYLTLNGGKSDRPLGRELDLESGIEAKAWIESRSLQECFQGRLLIVEDIDKRTMEYLGWRLDIDPLFFAGHLHIPWTGSEAQAPEQCILPSQTKRQSFTNIHHHRTVLFDDKAPPPAKKLLRQANISRKVVISPLPQNQYVGIVQHCTSVLLSRQKTHWIGIILVDRQLDGQFMYSERKDSPLRPTKLRFRMFLGGYEDFLDSFPSTQQDLKDFACPDRLDLQSDILLYWTKEIPESFDPSGPSLPSLAYYPLKMIAAEWIKYIGIMYRAVKQFEYSTSVTNIRDEIDKLNADMRALQRWRRRSMASEEKITAVIRMLEARGTGLPFSGDLASLIEDYQHILATVQKFGRHLETMLPVVTSLVQIVDSRRSIEETANISRLTVMALIFVPMAYVSSVFSMSERLGPGGPLFWLYFVVAIPITIVVILVAKPPLNMFRMAVRRLRG
ncbi:hypothetical protein K458DRAFT_455660 [Lentithecium fluviatile CBS 122367]|uniref:Cora-domain-containing protein n=1 Tax=Lentithecium fluviatile CBS 122367 TaxID=1168545 RepID=A0A6G1JMC4_9PLEO|nr:hypothetical protein K458DRAFT_455660 [Lentithecium fluviatile CBS 122367]